MTQSNQTRRKIWKRKGRSKARGAIRIVKVQLSLVSSTGEIMCLIYDQRHEWFGEFEATPELIEKIGVQLKSFWTAKLKQGTTLIELLEEAPWQEW